MSQRTAVAFAATLCVAVVGTAATTWYLVRGSAEDTAASADGRANLVVAQTTPATAKPSKPVQPRTEAAARQAAKTALDSYAAGNYAAFWKSWDKESQQVVSLRDYVRLFQMCKPIAEGLRFNINRVDVTGTTATVEVTRLNMAFTYTLSYEDGRWRFVLPDDTRAEYQGRTVEQIAQERKASGRCAE